MFKPGQILKYGKTGKVRYIFHDYLTGTRTSFYCDSIVPEDEYPRRRYIYTNLDKWHLANKPKPIVLIRNNNESNTKT